MRLYQGRTAHRLTSQAEMEIDVIMPNTAASETRKLRTELNSCRRQLKEALDQYEQIRARVGYDELKGWKPQKRIENQYGWVHAWLYPLSSYMNQHLNEPLSPDVRNRIHEIVTAIIAQLAVQRKYGISLPNDPRPVDFEHFGAKQNRISNQAYDPCVICSETRITHECHIIPRSEGGPYHRDNLVSLCPLHHHLFDYHRLSRQEWRLLRKAIDDRMEAAVVYADKVHLSQLETFWSIES